MENRDIKVLKYCFSVAGHKSRQETDCWLQKVKLCLQHAGAQNLFADAAKMELLFQVSAGRKCGKNDIIQYKVKIVPGGKTLILEQMVQWKNTNSAKKLMNWYAVKQNKKMIKEIQYSLESIHLEGKVILRSGWEKELIRRIGDMNRIIINDREIFEELNKGKVPACIKDQVYQEFLEYEKEIKNSADM